MSTLTSKRFVTANGICFEVRSAESGRSADRPGIFNNLSLIDLSKRTGRLSVSVYQDRPKDVYAATVSTFDEREGDILINIVRRAFDRSVLSFELQASRPYFTELQMDPSDFAPQLMRNDVDVRSYLIHKAYWIAFRYPSRQAPDGVMWPIQFDETADLDYLGTQSLDVQRNLQRLKNQGLMEKVLEANARPSEKMLQLYEAGDYGTLGIWAAVIAGRPDETDEHRFARLAVEEARKSVPEDDKKPHPRVGAVVVRDGKILTIAHRGEVPACHAEYVALEEKLPDELVTGSTVYTTLEPCTTRNHPKVPCATRLIERNVSRVVIGMLDPNEKILGRGWQKLRRAGITVDFFPPDLVRQVEELNRDFTRSCEQGAEKSSLPTTQSSRPNIRVTAVRKVRLGQTGEVGEWCIQRTNYEGQNGLVLQFSNEGLDTNQGNVGAIVKAVLIYKSEGEELLRIPGHWLDGQFDLPLFRVDDTHQLIVALEEGRDVCAVESHRATTASGDRLTTRLHRFAPMPGGIDLLVRLTNADTGHFLFESQFLISTQPLRLEQVSQK